MDMTVGVQLYSLRESVKNEGLDAVLRKVAAAGFDCVETAGFYGLSPGEVARLISKHGLKVCSAHISAGEMAAAVPYIEALGIKQVYIPWCGDRELYGEFDFTVRAVREAQSLLAGMGVALGYHNHAREYSGGNDRVADIMAAVPGLTAELDIFWATAAGLNPADLIKKYGKRLSALHIKEMNAHADLSDPAALPEAVPGEGRSGCREAIALAVRAGVGRYVLEAEHIPFDEEKYLAASAVAIRKMIAEAQK